MTGSIPKIRLRGLWPGLKTVALADNYRSAAPILHLAAGLFPTAPALVPHCRPRGEGHGEVQLFAAPTAAAEISWIGERIRRLQLGTVFKHLDVPLEAALIEKRTRLLVDHPKFVAAVEKIEREILGELLLLLVLMAH